MVIHEAHYANDTSHYTNHVDIDLRSRIPHQIYRMLSVFYCMRDQKLETTCLEIISDMHSDNQNC